ncbi:13896_t:CDS:2, partial [Acaulospora morrowiae]
GGLDATDAFESIGHSEEARDILKNLEVGELVEGAPPQKEKPTPSKPSPSKDEPSSLFCLQVCFIRSIKLIDFSAGHT